jgi:eukaryotic-like serine/threonine-protein kinase
MNCGRLGLSAGLCMLLLASSAAAAQLAPLPQMSVVQYGGYINDVFTETFKDRQVNFEIDLERGRGFYDGTTDGIFALPIKGLNEEQMEKDRATQKGAPICHLFVSSGLGLLVNGKQLDKSKLRYATGLAHDGEEIKSACFVCTFRQKGDGKELCLYGAAKDPVLTIPIGASSGLGPADFECKLGATNTDRTLVFTLFSKQEAALPFATVEGDRHPEDNPITTRFSRSAANSTPTAPRKSGQSNSSGSAGSLLQFDLQRSGYFRDGNSLPKAPHVLWKYPTDEKITGSRLGDPVVDKGVLYFGGSDGQLHALSAADGAEKWSRAFGERAIVAAPAVVDGMVYFTTTNDVKCVSLESGKLVWSQDLPTSTGETPPLIVGDAVFVAGGDGVYAFKRANGDRLWNQDLLEDRPVNSPSFDSQFVLAGTPMRTRAAASDGTLLFQPIYDQCRVVAINCQTGKRQWSYASRGWLPTHAAVNGRAVLFGGIDLYLHCVDRETGKAIWKSPSAAEVDAAPAVANGCVYFTARNARVHCVDLESGKRVWMHRMDPNVEGITFLCSPLVTDTTVYVGSASGFHCALDSMSGEFKWGISLGNNAQISGAGLATDGKRLFAQAREARESRIFAVGD